jgi:hypothetical protein
LAGIVRTTGWSRHKVMSFYTGEILMLWTLFLMVLWGWIGVTFYDALDRWVYQK